MNRIVLVIGIIFSTSIMAIGQSEIELPIEDQFDIVTNQRLDKSAYLKTFAGINEYCQNPTFRNSVDRILVAIHEYDSLVLDKLEDPTAYYGWDIKEENKTIKDVHHLEEGYSLESFVEHMRESCIFRNEIVENEENLRRGLGMESYDGKVLVLETEMTKYLRRIDRLMLRVDEHLHVLHLDQ
ncbi:MAG: hypothetical protein HRT61_13960 [Ekhidna sp.]|nr:hypothetical protein [Ekhidna sp.]